MKVPTVASDVPNRDSQPFYALQAEIRATGQNNDIAREEWLLGLASDHASSAIRRSALVALRAMKSAKMWPLLIAILTTETKNQNLRETAIKALGEVGNEESLVVLRGIMASERVARFGKQAAANAIRRIEARIALPESPDSDDQTPEYRDVFICHAREDRKHVVEPIAEALDRVGVSCWLDQAEIRWGDSVTGKVNEGLRQSRYVLAILSPGFLLKNWPKRELNAILNVEARTGVVRVLALLTGTRNEKERALAEFPLLNDKLYFEWDGSPAHVAKLLKERIARRSQPDARANVGRAVLRDLGELGAEIRIRKEGFSSRAKCSEAARYLQDIGQTMYRMADAIANKRTPYRELAALQTHAQLLPRALSSALTLMEAEELVAKLSALASSNRIGDAADDERGKLVADLEGVGGTFEALGAACRVHFEG
jgi:hypothetical protein